MDQTGLMVSVLEVKLIVVVELKNSFEHFDFAEYWSSVDNPEVMTWNYKNEPPVRSTEHLFVFVVLEELGYHYVGVDMKVVVVACWPFEVD